MIGKQVKLLTKCVPFNGYDRAGNSFVSLPVGSVGVASVRDEAYSFVDFPRDECLFDNRRNLRCFEKEAIFDKKRIWRCFVKRRDLEEI